MVGRFVQRWMVVWAAFAGVTLRMLGTQAGLQAASATYHVTRYTTEDGLPHNRIRALLQSRDGYLWVGTVAGLARFDGVRFKVFNVSNTPEMVNDAIDALAEDRQDGSLWINAGRRLLRYHQHRFERFDEPAGFPLAFGDLWPARQGGLWYCPRPNQLVRLHKRTVHTWQLGEERDPGDAAFHILGLEEDETGELFILMQVGLFRFNPETGTLRRLGPPDLYDLRYLLRQSDGTIVVAARGGLWRGNEAGWELMETVPPGDRQCPVGICPASNGDLWIPWGIGALRYPEWLPPRLARFRAGHSEFLDVSALRDYPITRLVQDREGHLWLGTESGLCQLRPQAVRVYAREHGLRNDYVKSLTEGPDGTIWLGTDQGLSGIKDGQVTNLPPVELPANWGRAEGLLADRHGRVWYGARANAVLAFDHGVWVAPAPLSLGERWVRTLYEDRRGRIWAGFDQGVAWINEAGAVQELPHKLSSPDVRVIHEDGRGDLWFGTYGGGLNRLHNGQITAYTTVWGEFNNRMWCVHEDADGVFWVGSRNGLNRFVPPETESREPKAESRHERTRSVGRRQSAIENPDGRFFTFTTRHGLYENIINNIQEDDFGYLWLSGPQGIYRVARQELNDLAAGRKARAQVLAFGEADGMLNSQCNGGVIQPSGCKDRSGRIWFPTVRGVAVIDPCAVRLNEVPPPVVIEQVKADDELILGDGLKSETQGRDPKPDAPEPDIPRFSTDYYHLAAGRARVLEIRYTANSFAAPSRMRFKYRLDGYDRDWRYDEDNRRVAFYTRLRPGAYRFQVAACNNHGVWCEAPATFLFTLAPHYWQTPMFAVGVGAAVVGLAAAIQAYRLRWQRRVLRLEQKHAMADERTRIARDLHDDLGTALTGLALQVDVLRREAHDGPLLNQRLTESAVRIRALAERMREVVWAINPRCDTVSSLASFLEQQAAQFLKTDALRCRFEFPESIPPLSLDGDKRHQLALSVREALSNAVRHGNATEVVLGLRIAGDQLIVWVTDNGRGFDVTEAKSHGRGLANITVRTEKIGGHCKCMSKPGAGTTIEFRLPLEPTSLPPDLPDS